MTPANLADRIEKLSPPDQLRLAADFLEAKNLVLARSLAQKIATEIDALLLLEDIAARRSSR